MVNFAHLLNVPPYPAGAFGPAPATVLGEADVEKLLDKAQEFNSDRRKVDAWKRWRIYTEDFKSLIDDRISALWHDPETRSELRRFTTVTLNLGLDVTRQIAVVYKQGARRTIDGVPDKQQDAFHQLALESWIDVEAPRWNQLAFLLGPVCVIPIMRRGRLRWETLLPHYYDIVRDPDDPMGAPLAVCFTVCSDDELSGTADTVIVDGVSWRYYTTGRGKPKLVNEVPHGAGTFPGAILRFDIPYSSDWWGGPRNQRLFDGTIDVGTTNTALNFVRKSQCHKLLTVIGRLSGMATGQKKDPETPVMVNEGREDRGATKIEALDFDTDPANFIKHIRFTYESVIESFGIPGSAVTFDATSGTEGERLRLSNEGLTEIRNEQIPFCRRFEHELWAKAIRVLRAGMHPLRSSLPSPDVIEDAFRIEFPELARTFADPNAETAFTDWQLSKGLTSELRLLRRSNPTMNTEQLRDLHEKILEERAEFNDAVTKRNLHMSGDKVQTAAEAFGAMGPAMRDAAKPDDDDNKED